jgi:hypothetical protein
MELQGRLTGVALFPGLEGGTTRYGVLLVGRSAGDISGGWVGVVHYAPPQVLGGIHHEVVGGRWASWARDPEGHLGLLLGRVLRGSIERDATALRAYAELAVSIRGGLGGYWRNRGEGWLSELVVDHGPMPPRLTGELRLTLLPSSLKK